MHLLQPAFDRVEREQGNYYMSGMFDGCTSFNQSLEAWNINPLAHSEGMEGMFNDSPAAELPFAAKWRAAGYNIDMYEEMQ